MRELYLYNGKKQTSFLYSIFFSRNKSDGSPVDVICLDFQKAFDKVPHLRLILKLKSHGMGNSIINWIEQWLTAMRQRVVVDGEVLVENQS